MKKFFTLIAMALISAASFADSYTITFKDSGTAADGSAVINPANEIVVADWIAEGVDYVAGFEKISEDAGTTKAYLGKQGYGWKIGSSSATGNIKINLSAKGTVKATSIVVCAAAYGSEVAQPTINGIAYATEGLAAEPTNYYTVELDGTEISSLSLSGNNTKRYYVKSITVNYEAASFDATLAHSPRYTAGKAYENVLGPDLIDATKTKDGAAKPGIADKYAWIKYVNPTSTLDDGTAEVQQSNRWTNYDPSYDDYNYGEGANWIQVKGANGSVNSPVLSAAWGKHMIAYVKDTKEVHILGIGSASGSADDGNNIIVVARDNDGNVNTFKSTPGAIYGKGTASDVMKFELDPTKAYELVIMGNDKVQKDIMVGAIRLYGASEVAGPAVHSANVPNYAYWETVKGPDMLGTKTKDGAAKPGIAEGYEWVVYTNPTSTLDDGTAEVQQSNRWTDLNPETGAKGEWIQVTGDNGSVNSPVLSAGNGKYISFHVTGTKKFGAYGVGSASGSAADGNRLLIHAKPYNSNEVIEGATEAGTIYGKGTTSDRVFVELDENETYEVIVEGDPAVKKDIMLSAITLQTAEAAANEAAGKGTLNIAIENAQNNTVDLVAGKEYTLVGVEELGLEVLTINANGATIDATQKGQIAAQKGVIINDAIINAALAPVVLSSTPNDALYTYGYQYGQPASEDYVPAVLYTEEEAEAYNAEHSEEIASGMLTAVKAGDVKVAQVGTAATEGYKYAGANQKVWEAETVQYNNCTIITDNSVIFGGNKAWVLDNFTIDNTIVEIKNASGDPVINFYGGANSIKDIVIKNSTLYNDNASNNQYFLRYSNASNAQAQKVFGTTGTSSWTMENNTLVNIASNQNFANNYVNKNNTTLTWKSNVFANVKILQKVGTNNVLNFTNADNTALAGLNAIDNTDASKFVTADENMGIVWNYAAVATAAEGEEEAPVAAPSALDMDAMGACFGLNVASQSAQLAYGDPRWIPYQKSNNIELEFTSTAGYTEPDPEYGDQKFTATIEFEVPQGVAMISVNEGQLTVEGSNMGFTAPYMVEVVDGKVKVVATDMLLCATNDKDYEGEFRPYGSYTLSGDIILLDEQGMEIGIAHYTATLVWDVTDAIQNVKVENTKVVYNIAGQRVSENTKGLVIVNGKKVVVK